MMKRVTPGAVLLLLSLSVAELIHARGLARLGRQAKPVATDEERGKLLATGKKIFVERCAKCHDERGDKPLKTGETRGRALRKQLHEEEVKQEKSPPFPLTEGCAIRRRARDDNSRGWNGKEKAKGPRGCEGLRETRRYLPPQR